MTERFLPGYEQDIEPGAGHRPLPGRRKVIVHTTETSPGSFSAVRNLWRGPSNWTRGLPHFLAERDRYVQLLPLDVCAYTSVGGPDAANKAGCPIQVEIVHRAAQPFDDVEYEALGRWLADLIQAGVDLDLSQCPHFYGIGDGMVLASVDSPARQLITSEFGGFANFNGVCGHQHLRGNEHWDPGALDIEHACAIARRHLEGDDLTMAEAEAIIAADTQNAENLAGVVRTEAAEVKRAVIEAIRNIEGNLAGVVRGTSAEELAAVLGQLRIEGQIPGDVDVAALAASVAGRLEVTPKT